MFTNKLINKANSIRKQNWGVISIIFTFLFFCLIIIFSFETLGLAGRQSNLDSRLNSPEKNVNINTECYYFCSVGLANKQLNLDYRLKKPDVNSLVSNKKIKITKKTKKALSEPKEEIKIVNVEQEEKIQNLDLLEKIAGKVKETKINERINIIYYGSLTQEEYLKKVDEDIGKDIQIYYYLIFVLFNI